MGKRTIAQAARNIVKRENVRITIHDFEAFIKERAQGSPKIVVNEPGHTAANENLSTEKK